MNAKPPIAASALLALAVLAASPARAVVRSCFEPTPAIELHRQNYALPLTYDFKSKEDPVRDAREFVFQFSVRKNLLSCYLVPLYFGYTQRSFWQVYDAPRSRPFRENDYNPELFLDYDLTWLAGSPWGFQLGVEHESNGGAVGSSRSWNRTFARIEYRFAMLRTSLKVWDRWDERPKRSAGDPGGDDNPEIVGYLGSWELGVRVPFSSVFEAALRVRKRVPPDHPTAQLDLDFHIRNGNYLHVQYFHGYGESLIDYDREVSRIGVGLAIRAVPLEPAAGAAPGEAALP
jgi:phospholipase A1